MKVLSVVVAGSLLRNKLSEKCMVHGSERIIRKPKKYLIKPNVKLITT